MSDFFGSINSSNVRFTDARINGDGPLPTNLSGPEGINGDPDGRYNFNESLLSGITPYAFGQGRMGSDRNYQQIPHRKQFPVPPLFLPDAEWDAGECVQMSHPIDMGDVVFIINAHHKHFFFNGHLDKILKHAEDTTMPQFNAFCNVCTVNYILAGVSNYVERVVIAACALGQEMPSEELQSHAWYKLLRCLKIEEDLERIQRQAVELLPRVRNVTPTLMLYVRLMLKIVLRKVIRDCIIPVGICSTSEKQGGQHEVGFKPVQAAASFFVTLTVDGQNRDLVNIWRHVNVEGGDHLTLHLEWCKSPQGGTHYVWNHYYKNWIAKTVKFENFQNLRNQYEIPTGRFQLVPKVFRLFDHPERPDRPDEDAWYSDGTWMALADVLYSLQRGVPDEVENHRQRVLMDVIDGLKNDQEFGFWHIGQSYTKVKGFSDIAAPTDDMTMLQGQLLQINFAPVWRGRTTGEFQDTCRDILDTDRDADQMRVLVGRWTGSGILTLLWCDLMHMSLFTPQAKRRQVGLIIDTVASFNQIGLIFPIAQAAQNALLMNASASLVTAAASQSVLLRAGTAASEEPGTQPAKRFKKGTSEVGQSVAEPQHASVSTAASAGSSAADKTRAAEDPAWLSAAAEESTGDWDFERELQNLVASDGTPSDPQKASQQKAKPPKAKS